jgi:hypothetical protein
MRLRRPLLRCFMLREFSLSSEGLSLSLFLREKSDAKTRGAPPSTRNAYAAHSLTVPLPIIFLYSFNYRSTTLL